MAKIEGMFVVEGLLEGRLPNDPDVADHLEDWVTVARDVGLRFTLEIEVGSFNLLPDDRPVEVEEVGGAPADTLLDLLNQLLDVFPEDERVLTSTLRSTEILRNREIQTLYVLGPTGRFERRDRTVSAVTKAPERPLTRRQMLTRLGVGVGIAAVVLLVASFFIDFGAVWRRCTSAVSALNIDNVEVIAGRYQDYFVIEKKAWAGRGRLIELTVRRTDRFPVDDAAVEKLRAEADGTLRSRLTLEDIVRGYVRCEWFDPRGEYLGSSVVRIAPLRNQETAKIYVPLPSRARIGRVVLTH
jgi:hypothetical protein